MAPLFATLIADADDLDGHADEWRHMRLLLPSDWSQAQRDACIAALRGACWMLRHRETRSPAQLLDALVRLQQASAELRGVLPEVPMAVWLHSDAAAAGLDAPAAGGTGQGASTGIGTALHLGIDDPTPMGDPLLFPSDLPAALLPMLLRLERNAREALELFPAPSRSMKTTTATARFLVGRMAEACEGITGKPLPPTGPEWFVALMRAAGPVVGIGPVGVGIVRAVLRERSSRT